jgi:hypothetical protein
MKFETEIYVNGRINKANRISQNAFLSAIPYTADSGNNSYIFQETGAFKPGNELLKEIIQLIFFRRKQRYRLIPEVHR